MIIKSFEINKKRFDKENFFLIYGENEGHKNEIIKFLEKNFNRNIEKFDEAQILSNNELFYEKIFNQSLFEKEKIVIINRCSDKICEIIENIIEKKDGDIKVILNANVLDLSTIWLIVSAKAFSSLIKVVMSLNKIPFFG